MGGWEGERVQRRFKAEGQSLFCSSGQLSILGVGEFFSVVGQIFSNCQAFFSARAEIFSERQAIL
ncbi:MAG: hypothetical protein HC890_15630 [Chloroflexaceae bacterium]|nr:hypothetical protein [Chloroflexaceae bacterium]